MNTSSLLHDVSSQRVSSPRTKEPRVVVIREEFIALTGNPLIAAVLNQLVYWSQRVTSFGLFLREEKEAPPKCRSSLQYGWFYKSSTELIEETMLCVTPVTLRRYLNCLEESGWIETRTNPQNKWDRTTQYRVNIRKLSRDLHDLGYALPGFLKYEDLPNAQNECFEEKEMTIEKLSLSREDTNEASNLNDEFFENKELCPSNGKKQSFEALKNDPSKGKKMTSRMEKNLGCNTETTTEITNKEHTQRTRACAREGCKTFGFSEKFQIESISQAMVEIWQSQIKNEKLHPTKKRSHLLEATLKRHFENNLKQWEAFCLRIKSSAFLMGGGPRKWHVTLDWILEEDNLIKILEGNFDDSEIVGCRILPTTDGAKVQELNAILLSIEDPVWRRWCQKLAEGVRIDEFTMLHKPLSVSDLRDIANAHFLECEADRLVWVGSSDQTVLNKIEDLRFEINWVFAKDYPNARTFRTRFGFLNSSPPESSFSPLLTKPELKETITTTKGEDHV